MASSIVGSTLAHYRIEAVLGRGGMGTVYRARDTRLDRTVAIKVLSAPGDDTRRQLIHEARAACALTHPSIVTIHSVEHQERIDFIVMEYVGGRPLSELIPAGGLSVDVARAYAVQIAAALAAAHRSGVVHRDIKPANVMITPDGQVKVLDFGIARRSAINPEAATRAMTLGTIASGDALVGTIGYLAPEQIAGESAQPASDIFAFGVLFYEMLSGRVPFVGDTMWAVMDATVRADPPSLETVRPDVSRDIAGIVTRCLSKRPADRYQSGAEVLAALAALGASSGSVSSARNRRIVVVAVVASLLAMLAAGVLMTKYVREWRLIATRVAVEEANRRFDAGDPAGAYRVMRTASARAPDDPELKNGWRTFTGSLPVTSDPAGAEVAFRAYGVDDEGWIPIGRTPLPGGTPIPLAQLRWRVTKEGYDPLDVSPNQPPYVFTLVRTGTAPQGMVHVGAGSFFLESASRDVALPEFWIDRFEVTNRQFKEFIARGGYQTRAYWPQPFMKEGRVLSWDEAMAEFRDATGRPGPSTWELGTYPDGQDEFPVSGVSWYEASAYGAAVGKRLPTAYHWYKASGAFGAFSEILRFSNFGSKGTVRVGSLNGLGPYGTYDMAGNVKEWCWNEATGGRRYVLGGAFNEASYQFRDQDAQPAIERSARFGFRCIKQSAASVSALLQPIVSFERDPSTVKPVNDAVFEGYRRLYDYDPIPLDVRVEEEDAASPGWTRQRVSFRAAYDNERVPADVYIPKIGHPPYQTIVYVPGADALMLRSSRDRGTHWIEFLVRSGRLVIFPVYQHTYERHLAPPLGPNVRRQLGIQRGQDFRRTVDYLETRGDVDRMRIAGYGLSMGAQLMPVLLAVEPRVRVAVMLSGGFESNELPPEWDPVNFTPRVRQPVLMVNGREDFDLPYETAQLPLFRMLGTPEADKRHAVLAGGHLPPKPVLVFKEILDWLDRYFGPVRD